MERDDLTLRQAAAPALRRAAILLHRRHPSGNCLAISSSVRKD